MTAASRSRLHPSILAGVIAATVLLLSSTARSKSIPAMPSSPEFTPIKVPARIAGLAFSYLRPAEFHALELPTDVPDFEQPAVLMPLHVTMADYGAVLFSIGARPAYGDGSVEDWAGFLTSEFKMKVESLRPTTLGGIGGIVVEATQETDAGRMRIRSVFIEDGTRLLNLTLMAPVSIWASVEPTLAFALSSFRLDEPRGSTAPVTRAEAARRAEAGNTPATAQPDASDETVSQSSRTEVPSAAALALADGAATLDSSHPFNLRLREQGSGLTPRLLDANAEEQFGVLGAGTIAATIRVPFGWHTLDDGRRTLVFDAAGSTQLNLDLRRTNGSPRDLLDRLLETARGEQPQIDATFEDLADGLPCLVLRNYREGDDELVQVFAVRVLRDDGLAHVARLTTTPETSDRGRQLAHYVLASLDTETAFARR